MKTYDVTIGAVRNNDAAHMVIRVEATSKAFAKEFVCRALGMSHLIPTASTWNTPLATVTVTEVTS